MRIEILCVIALTCAAASNQGPTTGEVAQEYAHSGGALEKVVEAREVHLRAPVSFWREGHQMSATSAVLLRVKIGELTPFEPRGIPESLFVYGSAVCEVLQSPLTGEAVLLAPPVPEGELPVLWLTPQGLQSPMDVDKELVQSHRPKGREVKAGKSLLVNLSAGTEKRVYKSVEEITQEVRSRLLARPQ